MKRISAALAALTALLCSFGALADVPMETELQVAVEAPELLAESEIVESETVPLPDPAFVPPEAELSTDGATLEAEMDGRVEDSATDLLEALEDVDAGALLPQDEAIAAYIAESDAPDAPVGEGGEELPEEPGDPPTEDPAAVSLSADAVTLGVGEQQVLAGMILSSSGAELPGKLTFASSNTAVATVSAGGRIKARKKGRARITISTDSGVSATCAVTVLKAPTSVNLNKKSVTLDAGKRKTLKVTFPTGQGGSCTFTSSRKSVAKVNAVTGRVTAVSAGTATITAKTYNGKTAKCTVRVIPPAARIVLRKSVSVGLYRSKKMIGEARDASDAVYRGKTTVTFSPKGVAKYEGGRLYGLKAGSAVMTVTASGLTKSCQITVRTWREDHQLVAVAHRGGAAYWPENTLAAFRGSAKLGVDAVELDVHTTRDGVQLVHHDPLVKDANGRGYRITKYTLKQLRAAKPNLCTLEQALKVIAPTKLALVLEFKDSADVKACVKLVKRYGMRGRVTYISFYEGLLAQVRKADSAARLGYLFNKRTANVDAAIKRLKPMGVMPNYANLTQADLNAWHKAGYLVGVWTVNSKASIRRMYQMDVDFITGNYPDRIMAVK